MIAQGGATATAAVYLLYDGHGSTRALTDLTGDLVANQTYAYDAFGNAIDMPSQPLTTLLYSGEQTDPTGFQYLRARYYDPTRGVFLSLDPFAGNNDDPLSLHKYAYAGIDPIGNSDPSGRFTVASTMGATSIGSTLNGITGEAGQFTLETLSGQTSIQEYTQWSVIFAAAGPAIFGVSKAVGLFGDVINRLRTQADDFKPAIRLADDATERRVFAWLSGQEFHEALSGRTILAAGDNPVRDLFGMPRPGIACDFASITRSGKLVLTESKGKDVGHAVLQLAETVKYARKHVGYEIGRLEIVTTATRELDGKYSVVNGVLFDLLNRMVIIDTLPVHIIAVAP
ncbi:MAG: RHS repeat-associated core domain-containing protein [Planctomycetota bacterium]